VVLVDVVDAVKCGGVEVKIVWTGYGTGHVTYLFLEIFVRRYGPDVFAVKKARELAEPHGFEATGAIGSDCMRADGIDKRIWARNVHDGPVAGNGL